MSNAKSITFTRLTDGTLLKRVKHGKRTDIAPVKDKSDHDRIAALTDDEIEDMARSDPDHPALDDEFWAEIDAPQRKEAISIKLDEDVLAFFREQGPGYQTRINALLRRYMQTRRKAG